MSILGIVMLFFSLYYTLKNKGDKDPRKQGIIFGCIFGIGISIAIIIESLCQ